MNATEVEMDSPGAPLYIMRISRMTIDKLGVRLYDTASAVVAELIANGYDADASQVLVKIPLGTALTQRDTGAKTWHDLGFSIEVSDNGHGMTTQEANEHFLSVGRERRSHSSQGPLSRLRHRPVMGRKGIGKLAPFGICRRMEVISAGGDKTPQGYLISHFILDYERILEDTEKPVPLETGNLDGQFQAASGTIIRLSNFLPKRVPNRDIFLRQLARRFMPSAEFKILIENTTDVIYDENGETLRDEVGLLSVPIQPETKMDLSNRPVITDDGEELPVTGWLALAADAYKDEETTGVRIYARHKIAGWTRDFEQPAGYTGEFTIRSYLVGEVTAEWLDLDDGDDLVKTDRQAIIWDSEYGAAFRKWGAELIKEMGARSRAPRRKRAKNLFFAVSKIEERIRTTYSDASIVEAALELANQIGSFASEDELADDEYVEDLSSVILTVAPHSALMRAFEEFERLSADGVVELHQMQPIFRKSRIAEMASYGQIAKERVRVIEQLEKIIRAKNNEDEFQKLLTTAPWLLDPSWSVISANQNLSTFKKSFEIWYEQSYNEAISFDIENGKKRPDFTLVDVGQQLHIVEIKPSGHTFDDTDAERLINYPTAFDEFFRTHEAVRKMFPRGYMVTLIADEIELARPMAKLAYKQLEENKLIERVKWTNFLIKARQSHKQFLEAAVKFEESNRMLEATPAVALMAGIQGIDD